MVGWIFGKENMDRGRPYIKTAPLLTPLGVQCSRTYFIIMASENLTKDHSLL